MGLLACQAAAAFFFFFLGGCAGLASTTGSAAAGALAFLPFLPAHGQGSSRAACFHVSTSCHRDWYPGSCKVAACAAGKRSQQVPGGRECALSSPRPLPGSSAAAVCLALLLMLLAIQRRAQGHCLGLAARPGAAARPLRPGAALPGACSLARSLARGPRAAQARAGHPRTRPG